MKPRTFQIVSEMEDSKLKTILATLYSKADSVGASAVASLLNAAFTQGKVVFLFSATEAGNMLAGDPNHKRASTNGSANSLILSHLIEKQWLTCEVQPDRVRRLPGLYVLRRDLWENILGTDDQDVVEQSFINQADACQAWLDARLAKSNKAKSESHPDKEVESEQDAPPPKQKPNKLNKLKKLKHTVGSQQPNGDHQPINVDLRLEAIADALNGAGYKGDELETWLERNEELMMLASDEEFAKILPINVHRELKMIRKQEF
ncbi:MAG: hypothetical protein ACOH5I_21980 [Oligoflexus sp.]